MFYMDFMKSLYNLKLQRTLLKKTFLYIYPTRKMKTAAILVIGDEILKGIVCEKNSYFLAKGLYDLGVKVERISIVGDNIDIISKEVRHLSANYDYILTTGGIGPTHDDLTYEAVAVAFNEPLTYHPELVEICKTFYKTDDLNAPGMKLAHVPASSSIKFGFDKQKNERTKFPNVSVRNVYMFPGIPSLIEYLFPLISDELFGDSNHKFHNRQIYLNLYEVNIVEKLNHFVKEYPKIDFGSYPEIANSYYKVKLTIESSDEQLCYIAYDSLKKSFSNYVVDYDQNPLHDAYLKLMNYIKINHSSYITESIKEIKSLIDKQQNIYIWFDGQIESTVLLHLYYCIAINSCLEVNTVYIYNSHIANEQDKYIKEANDSYKTVSKLLYTYDKPYSSFMQGKLLLSAANTETDLQNEFQCSIVNPISTWNHKDIWNFVRSLNLQYCILYDNGYTLLCELSKLQKNEKLKKDLPNGETKYLPAYTLND